MEKLVVLVVAVEPGHHGAELFADLFEGMFRVLTTHSQEMSPAAGLVSRSQSLAKAPDWISLRTSFIAFFESWVTTRGPAV